MAAYAALVSLLHTIDNIRLHPHPPISFNKKQLLLLIEKVTFLQEFLEGYNTCLGYSAEADPLEILIADAAHKAEDVIETRVVNSITNHAKSISSLGVYKGLKKVIKKMSLIEKEAMEIKDTMGVKYQQQALKHQLHIKSTPSDSLRSSSSVVHESRMVGVDDILLELKDKITSHCRDLQIIPIVGMGGTGKTTITMNIYQDYFIKECFDICAWATISQEFRIRDFFVDVLSQLDIEVDHHLSDDDLGVKLHKNLYGRKYLIVMDDMWSIDAWNRIRNFFPDNNEGSRIIATTRLWNLAYQLSCSGSVEMEFLDEGDSWDLLSKTVFGEGSCSLDLEEIGRRIGEGCKGLPLSIVVVGGLLAESKHTRQFWEYIEENIRR